MRREPARERIARATFAVGLVVLALTSVVAFLSIRSLVDSERWVEHTLAVGKHLDALSSSVERTESASLEFLVGGDAASLRDRDSARVAAVRDLELVETLTSDNGSQQRRVADFRRAFEENFVVGTLILTKRAQGGSEVGRALFASAGEEGRSARIRSVRLLIDEMTAEEEGLLLARVSRASVDARHATGLGGGLGLFALMIMGAGYALSRREARSRRTALEAIRESDKIVHASEARLTALYDAGIIGILISTFEGRVIEVNDALLDVLGFGRKEVLSGGFSWRSLTPPEWLASDKVAIAAMKATGVSGLREKEYLHKDGVRVPVLVGSRLLPGTVDTVITFVLDLTSNRQAAIAVEHLREAQVSETMFRGLLEAAPDAIVITNVDGTIRLVNEQTERLFGYARDELLGKPADVLMPDYFADVRVRAMGSGLDLLARRKDGSAFSIEMSLSNLEIDGVRLVIGSIRDVSERRRVVQALASAKDSAEAAISELEAFSYTVAHDLRAPLRGMNGFAQALLDEYHDKLDAEGKSWLDQIHMNARKMGVLIDALLSLAQLARRELRRENVDMSALVRATAAQLSNATPERVLELVVEDHVTAYLDPALAQALIESLIGNAWKFTRDVQVARIEFGVIEKEGARALFVRDNGAGFDMAFSAKLFEPFQRLHTVAEFPGDGIGLATVHRIVRRHDGRIWAEGSVNAGATFYFAFPAASGTNP